MHEKCAADRDETSHPQLAAASAQNWKSNWLLLNLILSQSKRITFVRNYGLRPSRMQSSQFGSENSLIQMQHEETKKNPFNHYYRTEQNRTEIIFM